MLAKQIVYILENKPVYNRGLFNQGPRPASNPLVVTYTNNLHYSTHMLRR